MTPSPKTHLWYLFAISGFVALLLMAAADTSITNTRIVVENLNTTNLTIDTLNNNTLSLFPNANAYATIQSKIDGPSCNQGCIIQLNSGTYPLTSGIQLRSGITLEGRGSVTLQCNNLLVCLSANSSQDVLSNTVVHDLSLLSNRGFTATTFSQSVGLDFTNISNGEFRNLDIRSFGVGLRGNGGTTYYNDFYHLTIKYNDINIWFSNQTNENHFYGGSIQNASGSAGNLGTNVALLITSGNNNLFSGVAFEGGAQVINFSNYSTREANPPVNNVFLSNRFELTGGGNNSFLVFDVDTGGNIIFNGYKAAVNTRDYGKGNIYLWANGPYIWKTSANAQTVMNISTNGSSMTSGNPALYVGIEYPNSGNGVALTLDNARSTGLFIRGVRAGVEQFSIDALDGTYNASTGTAKFLGGNFSKNLSTANFSISPLMNMSRWGKLLCIANNSQTGTCNSDLDAVNFTCTCLTNTN